MTQPQKRTAFPTPQFLNAANPTSISNDFFYTPTPPPAPSATVTPQQVLPTDSDGDNDNDDTESDLVNMYFLILAAFAVLLVLGIWYWRRGKKRKRLASVGRRHNALQQDLELGRQRGGGVNWLGLGRGGRGERVEGVDERGEAPPPYNADTSPPTEGESQVTVPERALVREESGALPKYEELRENPGRGSQSSRTPEGELVEEPRDGEIVPGSGGGASASGIIRSRDVTD